MFQVCLFVGLFVFLNTLKSLVVVVFFLTLLSHLKVTKEFPHSLVSKGGSMEPLGKPLSQRNFVMNATLNIYLARVYGC